MRGPGLCIPALPAEQLASAEFGLRYDDLDEEDRLKCAPAAHSLGPAVWSTLLRKHPIARWSRGAMVSPILTRLLVECTDEGRLGVRSPLRCRGALELSHVAGDVAGEVDRIIVAMWTELSGAVDATHGPRPSDAGREFVAARIFAEHVLTAVFAPPRERKVRRLGAEGFPEVPPGVYDAPPLEEIAAVPVGAKALGASWVGAPILFGALHTDPNRHVNSLVAPRLFEEAALQSYAALGESRRLLARRLEVGYQRPCFAGQRVRIRLQPFEQGGQLGACGVIEQLRDDGTTRPATYLRVGF